MAVLRLVCSNYGQSRNSLIAPRISLTETNRIFTPIKDMIYFTYEYIDDVMFVKDFFMFKWWMKCLYFVLCPNIFGFLSEIFGSLQKSSKMIGNVQKWRSDNFPTILEPFLFLSGWNLLQWNFLMLVLKCLKFNCFMLRSPKIKF